MAYQFSPEIEQLVKKQMDSGKYASEEELLKEALEALSAEDAELRAVEEALDALENGDPGTPLDEAFSSLRAKYGVSANG